MNVKGDSNLLKNQESIETLEKPFESAYDYFNRTLTENFTEEELQILAEFEDTFLKISLKISFKT